MVTQYYTCLRAAQTDKHEIGVYTIDQRKITVWTIRLTKLYIVPEPHNLLSTMLQFAIIYNYLQLTLGEIGFGFIGSS